MAPSTRVFFRNSDQPTRRVTQRRAADLSSVRGAALAQSTRIAGSLVITVPIGGRRHELPQTLPEPGVGSPPLAYARGIVRNADDVGDEHLVPRRGQAVRALRQTEGLRRLRQDRQA